MRALTPHEAGVLYLIASFKLDKTDAVNVGTFVNDSLIRFYEDGWFSDRVLLLITDAAPYMVLMGKNLNLIFSKINHVTCVAHGLRENTGNVSGCK